MSVITAITFDLDDTLWPIRPVIERAERRMRHFIAHRHPPLASRLEPTAMAELRESVAADHPHLRHDLSAMRRLMLKLAMAPAGCSERDVEEAFRCFSRLATRCNSILTCDVPWQG